MALCEARCGRSSGLTDQCPTPNDMGDLKDCFGCDLRTIPQRVAASPVPTGRGASLFDATIGQEHVDLADGQS